MKTKSYKNGKITMKAYLKPVGRGYEVGVICAGKPLFLGNFIHSKEANAWYSLMNREIRTFSDRHKVGEKFPKTWFTQYISNHLSFKYTQFVDKAITRHSRTYRTAFNKADRTYKKLAKKWPAKEKKPFLKAA